MKVTIIVPNWNGQDFLTPALKSLQAQTQPHSIIVVDNGSTDGSQQLVRHDFPTVQLLELDRNYGFAGGVNRGIEAALAQGAELVALFNNDAQADPAWLKRLVMAAQTHPEAGIITGKLLRTDRTTIDDTGECFSIWGMPFPRGRGETDKGQYDRGEYVFGASGGASLYRANLLKQLGNFDERFFAYFEDVDLSFRAQLAGWKVWYEPTAIAYHHIGGTSSKISGFTFYHALKNLVYLYSKNMPIRLYWRYFPRFLVQWLLILAGGLRRRQFGIMIRSLGEMIVNLPRLHIERWRIQAHGQLNARQIDALLYHGAPPTLAKQLNRLRRSRAHHAV